ncbi:hypothetical protein TIFTF001_028009 [Ficus carica]|uniref:Uncharacterized protein n=1 Tax=Ficus carica TaxID=3494 RepID=A0AA88DQ85_FICCA|nr:hypothetical protein TIFTF001_028009 [Ficus carica]
MTSAALNNLRFLSLEQNPSNPWPSRTTLCLGRIDNLGSKFFRNILALRAANRMDYSGYRRLQHEDKEFDPTEIVCKYRICFQKVSMHVGVVILDGFHMMLVLVDKICP